MHYFFFRWFPSFIVSVGKWVSWRKWLDSPIRVYGARLFFLVHLKRILTALLTELDDKHILGK